MFADFDMTQLSAALKDFYTVTSIRITVFDTDFREIIAYPVGLPAVCREIRKTQEGCSLCKKSDQEACRIASRRKFSYTYRCYAGLTESIVPIRVDSLLIGYLFLGNVVCGDTREEAVQSVLSACSDFSLNLSDLKSALYTAPLKNLAYVEASSHLMQSLTNYLAICRAITLREQDLPVRIDEYINHHFTENLRADDICSKFQIGRSTLYEISAQSYGTGLATHIRNLRLEYAKTLLQKFPDLPISEVAEKCGFTDYNYFITVFRKHTGMSPKKYLASARRKH